MKQKSTSGKKKIASRGQCESTLGGRAAQGRGCLEKFTTIFQYFQKKLGDQYCDLWG